MTEQTPGERPGHLDIDAVSAFVDRDLAPDEFATIEVHLTACPACHREVLEIRTTVMLLGSLPQYAPRRSFCLGQEHARASRRRHATRQPASLPTFPPGPTGAPLHGPHPGSGSSPAWLPGFQVAAVAIGALLFFVTTWDLATMPSTIQTAQFAAPAAMTERDLVSATVQPRLMATMTPAPLAVVSDSDAELESNAFQSEPSAQLRQAPSDQGTSGGAGASEEVLRDEAPRPAPAAAPAMVTSVTGAMPTPPPAAPEEPSVAPATTGSEATAAAIRPSWLRLAELALALLLAWLVVSIVGLRRVRG
jgi:hypothetical protein